MLTVLAQKNNIRQCRKRRPAYNHGNRRKIDLEKSVNKRESWIDCVKGFSIICVVLAHVNGRENFLYNWIYSFHMPIFFVISGIIFAVKSDWKNKRVRELIKKKAIQLLYPYLTFSLLTILWIFVSRGTLPMLEALKVTITLEGYSALWFLPSFFIAEVIFVILYKNKSYIKYLLIFMIAVCIGMYIFGILDLADINWWGYPLLNMLVRSIIGSTFIVAGYQFHKQYGTILLKRINVLLAICLLIIDIFLVQINGFVDLHYSKFNNLFLFYLFSIMGSYLMIFIIKFGIKKNSILEFFGRNSLIILGTHLTLPGMGIFREIFTRIFSYLSINPVSYFYDFCVCLCTMVFEMVLIICINRFVPFIVKPRKLSAIKEI